MSDNYNGNSIVVGSPKHTTDKRSTASRKPTEPCSGYHQEIEDEKAKQSAVAEESTQQETTTPTTHGRRGDPNDVNDANDDVSDGRQGQAATQ